MPAICTIVIIGIAAKFTMSPAKVTRENTNALIGSSAISAHADATSRARGRAEPWRRRQHVRRLRHADENAERRSERQREAGIDDLQRIGAEQNRGGQRRDVEGSVR